MENTHEKQHKNGFTVVELVVVIALIAILAAVLIPTFSSIIASAKHSMDVSAASNVNKALAIDEPTGESRVAFDRAKDVMVKSGFPVPHTTSGDNYIFYWMPDKNRVILYDTREETVTFPNEYTDRAKSDSWVNLSEENVPEEEEPMTPPEEESPETPLVETPTYTLYNGKKFNEAIKGICANVTKITFGMKNDHTDKTSGTSVAVSGNGNIMAYLSGQEIFVLSDGHIQVPANAAKMFSGLSSLTNVVFEDFSTANVTDMSEMFSDCSGLTSLDLSCFNTARVTKTESMFKRCTNVSVIYVCADASHWNTNAVTSSWDMFLGCTKLRNYNTDLIHLPPASELAGIFVPGWTHDITYANTGNKGYLTEKTV